MTTVPTPEPDATRPDTGPPDDDALPERTCIVTRIAGSPGSMIRFVLSPDGDVVADLAERLPGRGAWVTGTAPMVAEAMKRGAFARSFRKPARTPPDLGATIEMILRTRALDGFAIANKAGLVIAGFAKIEAKLREKRVLALVHAIDAGADGCRKLDSLAARQARDGHAPVLIENLFTSLALDLALGRSNVIHAAVMSGGSAGLFVQRCRRLAYFCGRNLGSFDVLGNADARPRQD